MLVTTHSQARKTTAAIIGFWAALLTAILNLWFYLAVVPALPLFVAPWQGLAVYTAAFQPLPFLAWIVPCFCLAPMILTMITCVHAWTDAEQQTWSLFAVVFAAVYAAVLSANYYIQMTVVQHNLVTGTTEGLALWLYGYQYPYNIPGALEGVGYGFLSISFLCAAQVFGRGRLQQWVCWTLRGAGITALAVFIDPLFRLPLGFLLVDGAASALLAVLAPLLLALLFRRSMPRSMVVAHA